MNSLETSMSDMSVGTKLNTPELDWSAKNLSHPQRIYSKINVINGVNTSAIGSSPVGAFSFQIPAKVLSLKDSYISMDIAIATQAGTLASVVAGNLGSIFSRIVITADNNTVLCDINSFEKYSAMLIAPSMKFETLEQECVSGTNFLYNADSTSAKRCPFNVLQKNSMPVSTSAITTPTVNKSPFDFFTGGTTAVRQENLNPNSYRHWLQQTNTGATSTTDYSLQLRLKDLLPHTICSLDQLLYFGGNQLQIDLYINSIDNIGYSAATTSIQGAAATVLPVPTFSNLQFNLCTESNVNTINTIVNKVKNEGLILPIPYIYGSKTSIVSGTSHSVNQVITKSSGNKLRFIAYAPFSNSASKDLQNSHSQINCSVVTGQGTFVNVFTSYNTSLDSIFIKSQSTIDCDKGEHYLYNKNELKGSALQGLELLSNDFVNIDSWQGKSLCEQDESVSDGLPITENHTWGLTMTTVATSLSHYVFYCMERNLVIGNFSVQVQ